MADDAYTRPVVSGSISASASQLFLLIFCLGRAMRKLNSSADRPAADGSQDACNIASGSGQWERDLIGKVAAKHGNLLKPKLTKGHLWVSLGDISYSPPALSAT